MGAEKSVAWVKGAGGLDAFPTLWKLKTEINLFL